MLHGLIFYLFLCYFQIYGGTYKKKLNHDDGGKDQESTP